MKQTGKVALCGLLAALSTVLMLAAYFPYLTYAIPALAGILFIAAVIEAGVSWAFGAYVATAILVFFLAETEAKLMFICFFGFYPILKCLIERLRIRLFEWVCKFACFNACMLLIYGLFTVLLGVSISEFEPWGIWGAVAFLAVGNVVFWIYDIAIGRVAQLYMARLHPAVGRILRRK